MPAAFVRPLVMVALAFLGAVAAAPQAAAEATVQVDSAGSASAAGKYLTISNVTFKNIGPAPITGFTVRSELVTGSNFVAPTFVFDADPHVVKSGCQVDESVQRRAIDCSRSAAIEPGGTYKFSFINVITQNVGGGDMALPSVKVTVLANGGSDSGSTAKVVHQSPSTDLAAAAGPVTPSAGSVFSVTWKVTNRGPHELPRRQLKVVIAAPGGTQWTGFGSGTACDAKIAGSEYHCTVYRTVPAGQSVSETWQLKAASNPSGPGEIRVEIDPYTVGSSGPEWLAADPHSANNIARFDVAVAAKEPGGGTPGPDATETPQPTPSVTEAALPDTTPTQTAQQSMASATTTRRASSTTPIVAGIIVALLAACGLTVFLYQRRRRMIAATLAPDDPSSGAAAGTDGEDGR